jgi:uncharacterized membrane protein YdbT with pleckstrin-like domain
VGAADSLIAVETGPGEHVIFEGHPSWRSIIGFYIKGLIVAAVLGGITYLIKDSLTPVTVVVVLVLVVLIGLIMRISTTYTISNQRLHIRRGIIARKVQQTRLERVQNVNTEQSVLQRILQVGTVDFDTAGTGDADFAFRGVAQPEKVMASVDQAQREHAVDPTGLGEQQPQQTPPTQQLPPQQPPPA